MHNFMALPALRMTNTTGVIYAAVGSGLVDDALFSASRLGAGADVTVFGDPETTSRCAEKAPPHIQCVDAIAQLEHAQWFGCESCARLQGAQPLRTSPWYSTGKPSGGHNRLVKIGSLLLAPYHTSFFLDADVVPCLPLRSLRRLMGAPGGSSIWDAADLLAATNRMYNDYARTSRYPGHQKLGGTPVAWPYLNSGVILFRPDRAPVQAALRQWLCGYCDGAQKDQLPGEDQPYFNAALYRGASMHHLRVIALPPTWNPRNWDMVIPRITNHSKGCCKGSAYLDHGCRKPNSSAI